MDTLRYTWHHGIMYKESDGVKQNFGKQSTVRARHRNTGGRNTATTTELGCRRIATNELLKYSYGKYIEAMKGHQKKVTMLL